MNDYRELVHAVADAPDDVDQQDSIALEVWRTCIHEAGHAVAGHALGFGIHHVKVRRMPRGAIGYASAKRQAIEGSPEHEMIWLAGQAAVHYLVRNLPHGARRTIASREAEDDREGIGPLIEDRLRKSGAFAWCDMADVMRGIYREVDRVCRRVEKEIIKPRWTAVLALAEVLWEKGYIRGHEAEALVQRTSAGGPNHPSRRPGSARLRTSSA
jgi:hypothetical protein